MHVIAKMLTFIALLVCFSVEYFRASITSVKTIPDVPGNIEQNGAVMNNGAALAIISALANNASPAFGNFNLTNVPNLAATTYLGQQMVGGIIKRFPAGAAATDSTDTATNIVNAIPGAKPNQTFLMLVANLGSGLITMAANTGVTLSGTMTISSQSIRVFLGQVTGSAAVTISNCFQFGQNPSIATPL